jgi:hypothetical protein
VSLPRFGGSPALCVEVPKLGDREPAGLRFTSSSSPGCDSCAPSLLTLLTYMINSSFNACRARIHRDKKRHPGGGRQASTPQSLAPDDTDRPQVFEGLSPCRTRLCNQPGVRSGVHTYSHFRFRVARSARLQERLKQAETVRFNLRHEQALESIMAAGERSWMAHAWWLERCPPHLYVLRNVNRSDPNESSASEEELPAEVLNRHRQLLLDLAREDEDWISGFIRFAEQDFDLL